VSDKVLYVIVILPHQVVLLGVVNDKIVSFGYARGAKRAVNFHHAEPRDPTYPPPPIF